MIRQERVNKAPTPDREDPRAPTGAMGSSPSPIAGLVVMTIAFLALGGWTVHQRLQKSDAEGLAQTAVAAWTAAGPPRSPTSTTPRPYSSTPTGPRSSVSTAIARRGRPRVGVHGRTGRWRHDHVRRRLRHDLVPLLGRRPGHRDLGDQGRRRQDRSSVDLRAERSAGAGREVAPRRSVGDATIRGVDGERELPRSPRRHHGRRPRLPALVGHADAVPMRARPRPGELRHRAGRRPPLHRQRHHVARPAPGAALVPRHLDGLPAAAPRLAVRSVERVPDPRRRRRRRSSTPWSTTSPCVRSSPSSGPSTLPVRGRSPSAATTRSRWRSCEGSPVRRRRYRWAARRPRAFRRALRHVRRLPELVRRV